MSGKLHEIKINNKNYGELNGIKIYLTSNLFDFLSKEKTKANIPLIELLRMAWQ